MAGFLTRAGFRYRQGCGLAVRSDSGRDSAIAPSGLYPSILMPRFESSRPRLRVLAKRPLLCARRTEQEDSLSLGPAAVAE
jgi:hypothetical protein